MTRPLGVGSCALFKEGYGDFLVGVPYAVVTSSPTHDFVVEIDLAHPDRAKHLRFLSKPAWALHVSEGKGEVVPLPEIPRFSLPDETLKALESSRYKDRKKQLAEYRDYRMCQLQPLVDMAADILAADNISKRFNELARKRGLNVSRARAWFFMLMAYGGDPNALLPSFHQIGKDAEGTIADLFLDEQPKGKGTKDEAKQKNTPPPPRRRGRPPNDPRETPVGWDFQKWWASKIKRGVKKFAKSGVSHRRVWICTLCHFFGCIQDKETGRIFHPRGGTYPSEKQFGTAVVAWLGPRSWSEHKLGAQTVRNHAGPSLHKTQEFTAYLLEELQWDAQLLDELPADPLDPTQPGMSIIRVPISDSRVGGVVAVGYDYATESTQAYLNALLSLAMEKAAFAAMWGVDDIENSEWPAVGLPRGGALRADRGPAMAKRVQVVVSEVTIMSQEWAAAYDPVGKALAEANHWRKTYVEGKPNKPPRLRSATEIIRDDLRKTRTQFHTSFKGARLEKDQIARGVPATSSGIWHDLVNRNMYAGQQVSFEKIARLTLVQVDVSIKSDGVELGGLRYLSEKLEASGLLERARGGAIPGKAFILRMNVGHIWLDYEGRLMALRGVPISFNSSGAVHNLTYEESMKLHAKLNTLRENAKQQQNGFEVGDEVARERDRRRSAADLARVGAQPSGGRAETHDLLNQLLKNRQ